MTKSKKSTKKQPPAKAQHEKFSIQIDSQGEVAPNWDQDQIHEFLNKKTNDPKLQDRKEEEE